MAIQRPIGEAGGINLYGYVKNDPINYWDPLGLQKPTRRNIRRAPSLMDHFNPGLALERDGVRSFDNKSYLDERIPGTIQATKDYFNDQLSKGNCPDKIDPFHFRTGNEFMHGDAEFSDMERTLELGQFSFTLDPGGETMTLRDTFGTQRHDWGSGLSGDAGYQVGGRVFPTQQATRGTWSLR